MDDEFYVFKNKYIINKNIQYLPILYYPLLSEKDLYYITKKNFSISLGLISFLDNDKNCLIGKKQLYFRILILNTEIIFLELINYLFKNNVKSIKIDKNDCNIPLIDYIKNNNLIHFISSDCIFIYSSSFYNLTNYFKMKLEFQNRNIYFNMEIRKDKDFYYLYTDSFPLVIDNDEYIKNIKCKLFFIRNFKKLIYNYKLSIFISYFEKDHYVLFMKPIKLFPNTIKSGYYNILFNEIIKKDIIWN